MACGYYNHPIITFYLYFMLCPLIGKSIYEVSVSLSLKALLLQIDLYIFSFDGKLSYCIILFLCFPCSCLQIARAFGASEVIAVDISDEKLQNATTLGATHTINAQKEDAVERIQARIKTYKIN